MLKNIPKIKRRTLPETYPPLEKITKAGLNLHSYDPDFWELEYAWKRRLDGMTNLQLSHRHNEILRNLSVFSDDRRAVILIQNWESNWYWLRKEHQVRIELAARGNFDFVELPKRDSSGITHTFNQGYPWVLFRYGKLKYLVDEVKYGRVRFTPELNYFADENNDARKDDEINKTTFLPKSSTKVTTESGEPIPILSDVKVEVSGTNYHLCCFSLEWDETLFEEFEADCCMVVSDPMKFASRVKNCGADLFKDYHFVDLPVEYYDPYYRSTDISFNPAVCKDFRFAYQREFRMIWAQFDAAPIAGVSNVEIGPSYEFVHLFNRDGTPVSII